MLLTKTNILSGTIPTISVGSSSDDAENITDQDFSLNYTSSSKTSMTIEFGATAEITYMALAGLIIAGDGSGTSSVTLYDDTSLINTALLKRNHCVVIPFEARSFTNLKIVLANPTADTEISIAYVSAGTTLTVPNDGETAGYTRHWLNRQIKTKATTSNLAAPVTVLRKPIAIKGTLSIPNMLASFSQEDYQDFLDFAIDELFFIIEDETKFESSYCCFEMIPKPPKAHSQTRSLNNVAFSFKVFNGL